MNKRLLKRFCAYGDQYGMVKTHDGWIATAFATIKHAPPEGVQTSSFARSEVAKELDGLIASAAKSRVKVTISDTRDIVTRQIWRFPVHGLKATGWMKGMKFSLAPTLKEVIHAQKPDRIVSVKVGKHARAIATVKDGECIGIFMPTASG